GMCRRAVQIKVILLHVLAVIPLAVGEAEQSFLQYRIVSVPQRQGETEALVAVANSGQAVLAPVISARSGLLVREVVPRVSVFAVILTHRAPLPFAEVWPPFFPLDVFLARLVQALLFCIHNGVHQFVFRAGAACGYPVPERRTFSFELCAGA